MNNSTETAPKPATISVPEAGRILGVGRDAAYAAARKGEIPVIQIGRKLRVSTAALESLLSGKAA